MNFKQKHFWPIFLTTGGMFAFLQYVLGSLWLTPITWWNAALQGVFFGLLMAIFGVKAQQRALKKMGLKAQSAQDLQPDQEKEILIDQDLEPLWEALVDHFSRRRGWKIKQRDGLRGRLILRHGMTRKSWGEKVTLDLRDLNDGFTLLKISSRPLISATVVDYGRNLENIKEITDLLRPLDRRGPYTDWGTERGGEVSPEGF